MASVSIVGEGDGAKDDNNNNNKPRSSETKVYYRKAFKASRNNNNLLNKTNPTALISAATAAVTDHSKSNCDTKDIEKSSNDNNVVSSQPPAEVIGSEDRSPVQPPVPISEDVYSAPPQLPASEDGNSAHQQQPKPVEAASGDSSSLNQHKLTVAVAAEAEKDTPAENGVLKPHTDNGQVKVDSALRSKQEVREMRRKLESELDVVRGLAKKIKAKQGQIGGLNYSHVSANNGFINSGGVGGLRQVHSEVASVGVSREANRPLYQLSVSVLDNGQGGIDSLEREKRTPKANQFYQSSEFLLAKDKFPPPESNKKTKLNLKRRHNEGEVVHMYMMGNKFFKSCSSLLEKLMKHKFGWVFNEPVDAEKLGLHDYHIIIKSPMDLGTIKSKLIKNWYESPKGFAEDVRLTFQNAMTYNPPGQDVHVMAEQLAKIFEERWAIIESDFNRETRFGYDYGVGMPAVPVPRKAPPPPPPLDMRGILDRSESITHHSEPKPRPITITPRTPAPKKPKAKDLNKRDMTYEEKRKLSTSLQSLPAEKLDTIIQIIRRRNSAVSQHDDEIEVDIDSVDAETLWELDRFVTNYKKSLSKHKRKAELAMQAKLRNEQNILPQAQAQAQAQTPDVDVIPNENTIDPKILLSSAPIHGDNQGDNRSRSSSSSSSSSSDSGSSSSDSDSDSSSDSGSDAGSPKT